MAWFKMYGFRAPPISNYRYRIELAEAFISITETDLWEFKQRISHYRYRFALEFQLTSITDTDFGLKTNQFCNHFGYNGTMAAVKMAVRRNSVLAILADESGQIFPKNCYLTVEFLTGFALASATPDFRAGQEFF